MLRFLADANFKFPVVKGCRRYEPAMDFLSANEAGLDGIPDPDVLVIAADQNRILVTHDVQTMPRHFGDFLMTGRTCPGVFLVSQYEAIRVIVDELVLIWAASDAQEWENRIVKLPRL